MRVDSAASSRPCRVIQILCQPSMQTAANRMLALNSSCPTPWTASAISLAKPATTIAPNKPAPQPPVIHNPRRGTPRVAARMMPTISPASSTSRKTMIRVASIESFLFHNQMTAIFGMEVVEELVDTRVKRADEDRDFLAGSNGLLTVEFGALE